MIADCNCTEADDHGVAIMLEGAESRLLFTEMHSEDLVIISHCNIDQHIHCSDQHGQGVGLPRGGVQPH